MLHERGGAQHAGEEEVLTPDYVRESADGRRGDEGEHALERLRVADDHVGARAVVVVEHDGEDAARQRLWYTTVQRTYCA